MRAGRSVSSENGIMCCTDGLHKVVAVNAKKVKQSICPMNIYCV